MSAPSSSSNASAPVGPVQRFLLVLVAASVLWSVGHVGIQAVWLVADLPEASPWGRGLDLLLIPVCWLVAWTVLRWARRSRGAA